ncbi:MAG: phosphatase PAP2 family protein [Candidatus Binataceae bacterium]
MLRTWFICHWTSEIVTPSPPQKTSVGAQIVADLKYALQCLRDDLVTLARSPLELPKGAALLREPVVYSTLGKVVAMLAAAYLLDTTIEEAITETIAAIIAPLQTVGKVGLYLGLAIWYLGGLYSRYARSRHAALTTLEATGAAGLIADFLKFTLGRRRPRQTDIHSLWFSGGLSFPSGEVSVSAAVAAGISAYWGGRWYVSVLAYAFAFMVGLGRMGRSGHWFSDVVGAMMLGYFTAKLFMWMHGFLGGRDSKIAAA